MFGLKTLIVAGGGVAAAAWAMNANASTGASGTANGIQLSPSTARPGQTISISYPGCNARDSGGGGTAKSTVFAGGTVALNANQQGPGLTGTAVIAQAAVNGTWTVDLTCGITGKFNPDVTSITVIGGYPPPTSRPTHTRYPSRGPAAGGGGSVAKGDVGMTAGGIALVAGGVGYGLWSMRRRDASTGTHVG